jgi:hypothetical protein
VFLGKGHKIAMEIEGMSEEDMFLMAIAASLADEHQGSNRSDSGIENHVQSISDTQSVSSIVSEIPEIRDLPQDTSVVDSTQRNIGVGKLIGTGYHECDNEEDAITGVLLKELNPSRVVRFDITHSRSSGTLSRQGSDQSFLSCDSFSGEGFDALTIKGPVGEFPAAG